MEAQLPRLEDIKVTLVKTVDDVNEMMTWLAERRDFLACDTETTGLNRGSDYIRLIQFGDHSRGWALPYADWRGAAKEVFQKYDRPIVFHNAIFDLSMLKKDGVHVPQRLVHDTLVMCFLKNPDFSRALKPAAATYVDKRAMIGKTALEDFMAGGGWSWETVPTDAPAYWVYGALDTCLTSLLATKLYPEVVTKYRDAYELELAVTHCLRDAELVGMLTDPDYIERAATKLMRELHELRPQIPCDPMSEKQLVEYLLAIGVPLFVRTEKGNLSTDKDVMRYFQDDFPVCALIEEYRSKYRMLYSYLLKFKTLAVDGVLRASTKVLGAKTGRMSVTDPPLQTLPRGRLVRDAIIARPGHRILMADFKAMELRALASDAGEENMLAAFNRGEDLHNYVSEALYGPNFTKQQRGVVKNGNFSKVYGAGVEKFATTAKIPVEQAREFLEGYDRMFPGVAAYMLANVQKVMETAGGRKGKGYIELIDGRRIPVEGDKAYKSTNYRIQGSCAIVTKRKICELDAAGLGEYFRLAVHDEVLFEVPEPEVEDAKHVIAEVLPDRYSFPGVVLEIDQDEVDRWGQHYRHDGYPKYVDTLEPEWLDAAEDHQS